MVLDERGRQLHDRATRGELLSPTELAELEEWYAIQDAAEQSILGGGETSQTASVQKQIDATMSQLGLVSRRLKEISTENDDLRQEIRALRHQLANLPDEKAA